VTSFSAAVSSGYGDSKTTTWINCNVWGKQAESLAPYLKQGTQVAVSGELTNRKYQTKEGKEGYSLEVRVVDLTLLGNKNAQGDTSAPQSKNNSSKAQGMPPDSGFDSMDDLSSDIPFMNPYKFNWRLI